MAIKICFFFQSATIINNIIAEFAGWVQLNSIRVISESILMPNALIVFNRVILFEFERRLIEPTETYEYMNSRFLSAYLL